jgi:flavin-dependent dehydrogenase
MAFDPLCGDGTGHAVREAILAAAVIRAIAEGGDTDSLLAHYQKRLLAAFQKHLELCLRFYDPGHGGEWWQRESDAVRRGLAWCAAQRDPEPEFAYRLSGFELQPVKCYT